jgi:hypothetical protein
MIQAIKDFFEQPTPKTASDNVEIWFDIVDLGDSLIREIEEARLQISDFEISGKDLRINNIDIY